MSANKALELILNVMGTLFGMLASFAFCLVTRNLSYILPFLSGLEPNSRVMKILGILKDEYLDIELCLWVNGMIEI